MIPTVELIARLQELEVGVLALQERVGVEVSTWYATYTDDAARMVRCIRLEAERLRNASTGQWPEWTAGGDEGDTEQGLGAAVETAASATEEGD